MEWQLQDAKDRFSKLVQAARTDKPQIVTMRGERIAVVLSAQDYDALVAGKPTIIDHLLSGPSWDDELVEAIGARATTPSEGKPEGQEPRPGVTQ